MFDLPIPPEYQPAIAAAVSVVAFLGWMCTYLRPPKSPSLPDEILRKIGDDLRESITTEHAGIQIVAAIDRLTAAVERNTTVTVLGRSNPEPRRRRRGQGVIE